MNGPIDLQPRIFTNADAWDIANQAYATLTTGTSSRPNGWSNPNSSGNYYYGPVWITPNAIPTIQPWPNTEPNWKPLLEEFEWDINICEHKYHKIDQEKTVKHICLYCRLEIIKKK